MGKRVGWRCGGEEEGRNVRSVSGERSGGWRATAFLVVLALGLGACVTRKEPGDEMPAATVERMGTSTTPATTVGDRPGEAEEMTPKAGQSAGTTSAIGVQRGPSARATPAQPGWSHDAPSRRWPTPGPMTLAEAEREVLSWGIPEGAPKLERSRTLAAETVYDLLREERETEGSTLECVTETNPAGFALPSQPLVPKEAWLAGRSEWLHLVETSHGGMDLISPYRIPRGPRNEDHQSDFAIIASDRRYPSTSLFDAADGHLACHTFRRMDELWVARPSDDPRPEGSSRSSAPAPKPTTTLPTSKRSVETTVSRDYAPYFPTPGTTLAYRSISNVGGREWSRDILTETFELDLSSSEGETRIESTALLPVEAPDRSIWQHVVPQLGRYAHRWKLEHDGTLQAFATTDCGPGCEPDGATDMELEPFDGTLVTPAGRLGGCDLIIEELGLNPITRSTMWLCPGVGIARIESKISGLAAVRNPGTSHRVIELVAIDGPPPTATRPPPRPTPTPWPTGRPMPIVMDREAAAAEVLRWTDPIGEPRVERSRIIEPGDAYESLRETESIEMYGPWHDWLGSCIFNMSPSYYEGSHAEPEKADWLRSEPGPLLFVEASHLGMDLLAEPDGHMRENQPEMGPSDLVDGQSRYRFTALFRAQDGSLVGHTFAALPEALWAAPEALAQTVVLHTPTVTITPTPSATGERPTPATPAPPLVEDAPLDRALAPGERPAALKDALRVAPLLPGTRWTYRIRGVADGAKWLEPFTKTVTVESARLLDEDILEATLSQTTWTNDGPQPSEGPFGLGLMLHEGWRWRFILTPDGLWARSMFTEPPVPISSLRGSDLRPQGLTKLVDLTLDETPGQSMWTWIRRRHVETPAGSYENCAELHEWFSAGQSFRHWFCPGIGFVRTETGGGMWCTHSFRIQELIDFRTASTAD